jgi:hypothetical protein
MAPETGRDAATDRTGNGSAAGLSGQRCGDQEDCANNTNDRELVEHY